jgi:hypothetical protein
MKTLMAIMFILGIPWALLVGGVVLSPIGIFLPEYKFQMHDTAFSLLASACGMVGFFVWFGYRFRWRLGWLPWLTQRQFWSLSLVHHAAWVFLLPWGFNLGLNYQYWETLADFWFGDGPNLFRVWIVVNLLISILALFFDPESVHTGDTKQNKPSEATGHNIPS